MGVRFVLGAEIGRDISFEEILSKHDAVFLGMGTYKALDGGLDGREQSGVYNALDFLIGNTRSLLEMPAGEYPFVDMKDKRVVVLGGGDTAMDCVRTSVRQGAREVHCLYRRDRENMPGSQNEVNNAIEEGVNFHFNVQPLEITGDVGTAQGVRVVQTQLGPPDESGRRRPEPVPESERVFEADAVIIAFGFNASPAPWFSEHGIEVDEWGLVRAAEGSDFSFQTSHSKVFAAGDMVRGADLVVTAIADARKAAQGIVNWLT